LCGSSYLNERFESYLKDLLGKEDYLASEGATLQSIIDSRVLDFENVTKRNFDVMSRENPPAIRIRGLDSTRRKEFTNHYIHPQR
jgi:hypothetical protein